MWLILSGVVRADLVELRWLRVKIGIVEYSQTLVVIVFPVDYLKLSIVKIRSEMALYG